MQKTTMVNGASGRGAERAVGERSGEAAGRVAATIPDPELVEQARRRQFTAEYKLRIVQQADACTQPGEVGALLRREGLYSSLLSAWRQQRDAGALAALRQPRGRKKAHPLQADNAKLRARAERAEAELVKAHKVIEVQGNVSALLAQLLEANSAGSEPSSQT